MLNKVAYAPLILLRFREDDRSVRKVNFRHKYRSESRGNTPDHYSRLDLANLGILLIVQPLESLGTVTL